MSLIAGMSSPKILQIYRNDPIVDAVWESVFDPFLELLQPSGSGDSAEPVKKPNRADHIREIRRLYHKAVFGWFGEFKDLKAPGDRMISCSMHGAGVDTDESFNTCKLWQFCPFCRFRMAAKAVRNLRSLIQPDHQVITARFGVSCQLNEIYVVSGVVQTFGKTFKADHWMATHRFGIRTDYDGDRRIQNSIRYVGLIRGFQEDPEKLAVEVSGADSLIKQASLLFESNKSVYTAKADRIHALMRAIRWKRSLFGSNKE